MDVAKLVALALSLDTQDQASLMAFAQFLAARGPSESTSANDCAAASFASVASPASGGAPGIPGESVVAAIKRLSALHPAVNRQQILGEAAQLVESYVAGACSRESAIAELEALFASRACASAKSSGIDPSAQRR